MNLICDSVLGTENNDLVVYLRQNGLPNATVRHGDYDGKTLAIANIRNHLSDVGHYVVFLGVREHGTPFYFDPYYGSVFDLSLSDWTNGDKSLVQWYVDTTIPLSSIEMPDKSNIEPVVIFLADPRHTLKSEIDTTLDMERAANEIGLANRYATIQDCLIVEDILLCNGIPVGQNDTVFIRLDPSLDGKYFDFLRTLCHVNARFVNKPQDILTRNDKLLAKSKLSIKLMEADDFSLKKARQIFVKHGIDKLVIKPVSMFGGEAIQFVNTNQLEGSKEQLGLMLAQYGQLIVEPFVPVNEAIASTPVDTRVVAYRGKVIAYADRLPPENSLICNLSSGGSISFRTLTEGEMQLALQACSELEEQGITFAGIDLLNGKLSEINVSCPGAVKHVSQAVGFDVSKHILRKEFSL